MAGWLAVPACRALVEEFSHTWLGRVKWFVFLSCRLFEMWSGMLYLGVSTPS